MVINKLTKKSGDVVYVQLAPVTTSKTLLSPGELIHRTAVICGGIISISVLQMAPKHREVDEMLGFDSGRATEMDPIFSCLTAGPLFSHHSLL